MSKARETGLGLLFFGTLIGLGYLILTLTDHPFKKKYELTVYFDNAAGLKEGDNVRIMGVTHGSVKKVEFLPTGRDRLEGEGVRWVKAVLNTDVLLEKYLKEDYKIWIRDANMLGGKAVEIDPGTSRDRISDRVIRLGLTGESPGGLTGLLENAGELIEENGPKISNILDRINAMAEHSGTGEGILGKLVYSTEWENKFSLILEDIDGFTSRLKELTKEYDKGKGVLWLLLNDDKIAGKVRDLVDQVTLAVEDAREAAPMTSLGSFLFGSF